MDLLRETLCANMVCNGVEYWLSPQGFTSGVRCVAQLPVGWFSRYQR